MLRTQITFYGRCFNVLLLALQRYLRVRIPSISSIFVKRFNIILKELLFPEEIGKFQQSFPGTTKNIEPEKHGNL